MKFTLVTLAVLGAVEARHHHHHHNNLLQTGVEGIDKKTLHPDQHWRKKWPQGLDDSTDDDKILNWMRTPKDPEDPIQYWDKMRQWSPGTWPVYHTWNKDFDKATQHYTVDDGSDDNEVVNVMHNAQGI